jgi:hypothetical protein
MFLTGIREFNNDLAIYELTLSFGNEILNDEKNTQFSCMFTNSFKVAYCCKQKGKKRTIKIIFRGQSRTVNNISIKTHDHTVVNLL